MDNVRYRVATTTRKNKGSGYELTSAAAMLNASGRPLASPAGDGENYHHHPGRRQWSRRRDIYAVPDDAIRGVPTMSPSVAAVADAVRRRVDAGSSDVYGKTSSSTAAGFWAQPAGTAAAVRSRSRPRPPLVLERRVQRGGGGGGGDSEVGSRYLEHHLDEYERQRRRQLQQQTQRHAAGLNPSVEYLVRRTPADGRPQLGAANLTPPLRLSERPVPPSSAVTGSPPLSPSYVQAAGDNKALLKEALISAAAAKLARSSSARSAGVRPVVVVRNGPAKSSSDERVDLDHDATNTVANWQLYLAFLAWLGSKISGIACAVCECILFQGRI